MLIASIRCRVKMKTNRKVGLQDQLWEALLYMHAWLCWCSAFTCFPPPLQLMTRRSPLILVTSLRAFWWLTRAGGRATTQTSATECSRPISWSSSKPNPAHSLRQPIRTRLYQLLHWPGTAVIRLLLLILESLHLQLNNMAQLWWRAYPCFWKQDISNS